MAHQKNKMTHCALGHCHTVSRISIPPGFSVMGIILLSQQGSYFSKPSCLTGEHNVNQESFIVVGKSLNVKHVQSPFWF